ncbi:MAG: hypothetical protein ACTSO3_16130 [Candidatus Heimdallarchaeaceae archaeon]
MLYRIHLYRYTLVVLVLLLFPISGYCWTKSGFEYTTDGSYSDVSSAISDSSDGDVIIIPNGTFTWSNYISTPKNITIRGQGISNTIIINNTTKIFELTGNGSVEVYGIHFKGDGTQIELIRISGTGGWKIHDCKFECTTSDAVIGVYPRFSSTNGQPVGVVYDCIFIHARIYVQCSDIDAYNPVMDDSNLLGTANTVYVEDCTFNYSGTGSSHNCIDSQYGGSYVFRFNVVTDAHLEVHSAGSGDLPPRAGRYWEIYGNTLYHPATWWDRAMFIRGGSGVIFDNSIPNSDYDSNRIDLDVHSQRWGSCTGSSPADGNTPDENGWPCRDQIGRPTDEFEWTSSSGVPSQDLQPAYFWNNTNFTSTTVSDANDVDYIVQNRDYYEDDDDHMSSGLWIDRPANPSDKDGYWATDKGGDWNKANSNANDGALYVYNGVTEEWELYYVPYTYPHPLRGSYSNMGATLSSGGVGRITTGGNGKFE